MIKFWFAQTAWGTPNFVLRTSRSTMYEVRSPRKAEGLVGRKPPKDVLEWPTSVLRILIVDQILGCWIFGWHFTNIKTAEEIHYKLRSYLHHIEFDLEPLSVEQIRTIMNEKCAIYNLNVDQRTKKFGKGEKLLKYDFLKPFN